MKGSSSPEKTDARCLVEAAAWLAQSGQHDLEESAEFEAWRAADPRHQAAWQQVQTPWRFIGEQGASPELLKLRRVALANAHAAARQRWTVTSPIAGLRARLSAIAASVLLAAVGVFSWYFYSPDTYRTQAGERRMVTLADGSQVHLDSSTELFVRYSPHARDLTLSRGQARFDVVHDAQRPFSVAAAGERVIATGTAFNVEVLGSGLLVTLIEGHVVVLPQSTAEAGGASELHAGQQLVISPKEGTQITAGNIEHATAWLNGQLVFDNEPLTTVIERVNRYSSRPLILADERAAGLRISGVFNTGDVEGFVATLTHYLPVDADRREGSIRLSHR